MLINLFLGPRLLILQASISTGQVTKFLVIPSNPPMLGSKEGTVITHYSLQKFSIKPPNNSSRSLFLALTKILQLLGDLQTPTRQMPVLFRTPLAMHHKNNSFLLPVIFNQSIRSSRETNTLAIPAANISRLNLIKATF
jgi:hypothetical protein